MSDYTLFPIDLVSGIDEMASQDSSELHVKSCSLLDHTVKTQFLTTSRCFQAWNLQVEEILIIAYVVLKCVLRVT